MLAPAGFCCTSAVRRRQQRLGERLGPHRKAAETCAACCERGCDAVAEHRRVGGGRSGRWGRRVGQHGAAVAVARESETAERIGAAEVQLRSVAEAVLNCEHAARIGNDALGNV